MTTKPKNRPGRPKSAQVMRQFAVRIPNDMIKDIDCVISERAGQVGRTTIVREMIARGLRSYWAREGV